jgi:hypothetical protein
MILGETLTDADGQAHRMAGLLPVETSFAQRKLHLGYRNAVLSAQTPLGPSATVYGAHEFHYASTVGLGDAPPLFDLSDAAGNDLGPAGLQSGNVFGIVYSSDRPAVSPARLTHAASAPHKHSMIQIIVERWSQRDGSVDWLWSIWQDGERKHMGGGCSCRRRVRPRWKRAPPAISISASRPTM